MAWKPKNANIDIRQTARVFDEQAFVDGVFNDDYILVVGSGVILDRKWDKWRREEQSYLEMQLNGDKMNGKNTIIAHRANIGDMLGNLKADNLI